MIAAPTAVFAYHRCIFRFSSVFSCCASFKDLFPLRFCSLFIPTVIWGILGALVAWCILWRPLHSCRFRVSAKCTSSLPIQGLRVPHPCLGLCHRWPASPAASASHQTPRTRRMELSDPGHIPFLRLSRPLQQWSARSCRGNPSRSKGMWRW